MQPLYHRRDREPYEARPRQLRSSQDKIHIKLGEPDKVIVEQAKKLDVSLVVVGNSARSGLSAAFMGNTVEKVLDKLECDVLSMP